MTPEELDLAARRAASQAYVDSLPAGTVEELQLQVLELNKQLAQVTAERDRLMNHFGSNTPQPKEGEPGYVDAGGGWIPCVAKEKP
jgi:hypothetical protein